MVAPSKRASGCLKMERFSYTYLIVTLLEGLQNLEEKRRSRWAKGEKPLMPVEISQDVLAAKPDHDLWQASG
jgi:hypothetical protein